MCQLSTFTRYIHSRKVHNLELKLKNEIRSKAHLFDGNSNLYAICYRLQDLCKSIKSPKALSTSVQCRYQEGKSGIAPFDWTLYVCVKCNTRLYSFTHAHSERRRPQLKLEFAQQILLQKASDYGRPRFISFKILDQLRMNKIFVRRRHRTLVVALG